MLCAKELNAIIMNPFTTCQTITYLFFVWNCEFHLFYGLWTLLILICCGWLPVHLFMHVRLVCYFFSRLVFHSVSHRRNNDYSVLLFSRDVKQKCKYKQTKFTPRKSFLGWFLDEEEMSISCSCTRTFATVHMSKKSDRKTIFILQCHT